MLNRILVTVPDLGLIGGKASYFSSVKEFFSEDVEYFTYGPRSNSPNEGKGRKVLRLLADYWRFFRQVHSGNYDLIHINPSLEPNGFLRDSVFMFIAHSLCGLKVLVFWHGWSTKFEKKVEGPLNWLYKLTYQKSAGMIVLASDFIRKLESWNYKGRLFQETTLFDEALLSGMTNEIISAKFAEQETRLLFLSRVEENKGVFEILQVFEKLKKDHPNLKLDFGGTGSALEGLREKIDLHEIKDVRLLGFVVGEQKKEVLHKAHIFVFPSSHDEGLPIAVLEAMGCGMPVITTWNAGIKDFFENEKMGAVLKDTTAHELKTKLLKLLEDRKEQEKVALYNHGYAKQNFTASKVVLRLESIYRKIS